jgi:hypothetical protein
MGIGVAAGAVAGPCVRYVWPAAYAPILVFCSFWCIVYVAIEFMRSKRPAQLAQTYYVATALYLVGVLPLTDGLRNWILVGADKSGAASWGVAAMSIIIVTTACSLLVRASFTREEERAIWLSSRRSASVEGIADQSNSIAPREI